MNGRVLPKIANCSEPVHTAGVINAITGILSAAKILFRPISHNTMCSVSIHSAVTRTDHDYYCTGCELRKYELFY